MGVQGDKGFKIVIASIRIFQIALVGGYFEARVDVGFADKLISLFYSSVTALDALTSYNFLASLFKHNGEIIFLIGLLFLVVIIVSLWKMQRLRIIHKLVFILLIFSGLAPLIKGSVANATTTFDDISNNIRFLFFDVFKLQYRIIPSFIFVSLSLLLLRKYYLKWVGGFALFVSIFSNGISLYKSARDPVVASEVALFDVIPDTHRPCFAVTPLPMWGPKAEYFKLDQSQWVYGGCHVERSHDVFGPDGFGNGAERRILSDCDSYSYLIIIDMRNQLSGTINFNSSLECSKIYGLPKIIVRPRSEFAYVSGWSDGTDIDNNYLLEKASECFNREIAQNEIAVFVYYTEKLHN